MAVYDSAGFSSQRALQGVKIYHNLKIDIHDSTFDYSRYSAIVNEANSTHIGKTRWKQTFTPDEKFLNICKSIGYSPNTQYQLLQLIIPVEEKIMEEVKRKFDNFLFASASRANY